RWYGSSHGEEVENLSAYVAPGNLSREPDERGRWNQREIALMRPYGAERDSVAIRLGSELPGLRPTTIRRLVLGVCGRSRGRIRAARSVPRRLEPRPFELPARPILSA